MKLNITVDLKDFFVDETGETVEELVANLIRNDIHAQLKKNEHYKKFVNEQSEKALRSLMGDKK
jgi:hypothetical protein